MRARIRADGPVVLVEGELGWSDHGALERSLKAAMAADAAELVVDLSGTTFVLSSALALLVSAGNQALAAGKRVTFRVPAALQWVARYLEQTTRGFTIARV